VPVLEKESIKGEPQSQSLLSTFLQPTLSHLDPVNGLSPLLHFFSNLKDKNNIDTMAYLLTNASRLRASKEHAEHRGIPFEDYLARRQYWSKDQRDEYAFYERGNRIDYFKTRYYPDDCEECKRKADIKKMQDEYEREQEEKARVRRQEAEVRQKEKDREANERRMMQAEDKPRTPPVKVKISIEQNKEVLRLQHQKDMLMAQAQEIQAQLNKLALPKKALDTALERCMLCGKDENHPMFFPSKTHRTRHLESTKHKIRAGLMAKDVYPRHCDTCDYDAKTKHAWEQHCEGKKHLARSTQTVIIPTTQEVEKESSEGESQSAKSEEDIVESS